MTMSMCVDVMQQVTGVTPPEMPAGNSESNTDANKPLRLGPPTVRRKFILNYFCRFSCC